ncbi:hypothetical protein V8G54_013587, partial [Vigna mungo]
SLLFSSCAVVVSPKPSLEATVFLAEIALSATAEVAKEIVDGCSSLFVLFLCWHRIQALKLLCSWLRQLYQLSQRWLQRLLMVFLRDALLELFQCQHHTRAWRQRCFWLR